MNTTLIVLTVIFSLLSFITARINYSKDHSGYSSVFDFFWLDNCLVFREGEVLLFALAGLTSFLLVDHTVWGQTIWGYAAFSYFFANVGMSLDHLSWYKICWKNEKGDYLGAFIVSILSSLIWLFIIITVVTRFVMFVLEAEPWNR